MIIGNDAASEIRRTLEPIDEENKRRDRTTKILLNTIWHMMQISNPNVDEKTIEQLVTRAVQEIDNAGNSFTANEILDAAIAEKNASHNFVNGVFSNLNSQNNFSQQKKFYGHTKNEAPASSRTTDKSNNASINSNRNDKNRNANSNSDLDPLLNYNN